MYILIEVYAFIDNYNERRYGKYGCLNFNFCLDGNIDKKIFIDERKPFSDEVYGLVLMVVLFFISTEQK